VEELTRMILESEQLQETAGHYELKGDLRHLSIPATLHDSLMARLDRLARGKGVAQWGAVLGRGFSSEMLAAVTPFDDAALQEGLRQLMAAELLFQQGLGPQASYRFKHALIRDAAYESMLKRHRQDMHQQIAEVLVERFAAVVETRPELVAHHYTEAGCNEQAIPYWSRAGQRAAHHSAYQEAVMHLTKGLDLLPTRLATPEQIQQKLELYMSLGPVLMAIEGHATPEVEQLYRQALALCWEIGDTLQLFRVLWGLWRFYLGRAVLPETRELAEQLLMLAQQQVDTGLVLQAHVALGVPLFYAGEFVSAYSHLRQVSALYDVQQHATHALLYGQVPDAYALVYTASVLWCLGYPAQAKQAADEALRGARSLAHPFTLVIVLILSGIALSLLRDHHTVYEQVEEVVRMSAKQTFPVWHAIGTQLQGWALANRGQVAKGLGQFLQGLRTHRATEGAVTRPFLLCLLLDLYVQTRQTEAGLALIEEGLAFVTEHGTYGFHAEFYRYKGAFLLMQETPDVAQAEVCLHHALDVARRQQAKSLELRAAMSLARLWQSQDKRQDAYDLLAPVYQWFTEGFDTVDLQEAKALLVELRQL
jgi:predicted ATPase